MSSAQAVGGSRDSMSGVQPWPCLLQPTRRERQAFILVQGFTLVPGCVDWIKGRKVRGKTPGKQEVRPKLWAAVGRKGRLRAFFHLYSTEMVLDV